MAGLTDISTGNAAITAGGTMLDLMAQQALAQERRKWNMEDTQDVAQINYMYGEMAADNAANRQIDMYNKLYSIPAQMQQIKDAGLSPGLMYSKGTGGSGGASAPMGQGAGGQQAKMLDMQVNMDIASKMAQNELALAQARKLNAEAEITEKKGEEEANARITNLLSDAGLKDAQTLGQKYTNNILELESYVQEMTVQARIEEVWKGLDNLIETNRLIAAQATDAETTAQFNKDNYENMLKQSEAQTMNILTDTLAKKFQMQIEKEKINIMYKQIALEAEQNDIAKWSTANQQKWYENQVAQRAIELGLTEKSIKFDQTYGPIRDVITTVAKTGLAIYALRSPTLSATLAGKTTVGNVVKAKNFITSATE